MTDSRSRAVEHQRAADYFDRKAELFDSLYTLEKSGAIMRYLNRHFRSDIYVRYGLTLDHVRASGARSVLDVGVGSGRYIPGYLEAGVSRVVGVDISTTMLELARQYVQSLGSIAGEVELIEADIDAFTTAEKFDVVVAMGFFDYLANPQASLRKLRDLAGHSVIASFPSKSVYRTPLRKLRYRIKRCPVYFFDRNQITDLARSAGFSTCNITKIDGAGMDYVATFRG